MPVPLKNIKKNSFLGVLVVLVGRVGHQSWEPGAPSPRLFVDESTPSRRPSANQPAIIPAMGPSGVTSWSSTQILKHRYLSKPIKTHQNPSNNQTHQHIYWLYQQNPDNLLSYLSTSINMARSHSFTIRQVGCDGANRLQHPSSATVVSSHDPFPLRYWMILIYYLYIIYIIFKIWASWTAWIFGWDDLHSPLLAQAMWSPSPSTDLSVAKGASPTKILIISG